MSKLERLSRGAESERVEQTGQPITIRLAPGLTQSHIADGVHTGGFNPPHELPPGSPN
jgi:hypothetical protein